MEPREEEYFKEVNISGDIISYDKDIQSIAKPLFYERSEEKAVLLLHGFGGTPFELKELAEYLANENITVYVPLLGGHGTNLKDLSKLKWTDAYLDANNALEILQKHYTKVYVGGLCTGGLFSLALSEDKNFEGVMALSTPMVLSSKFVNVISKKPTFYTINFFTPYLRRIEYGISRDPEVAKNLPSNDRFPVKGLITMYDLTEYVKKNIDKVDEPVLIIHSNFDNRASPESANYLNKNIPSNKTLIWLNNSGHVITMDYDKGQVFQEVKNFIENN